MHVMHVDNYLYGFHVVFRNKSSGHEACAALTTKKVEYDCTTRRSNKVCWEGGVYVVHIVS
jgi:hypothetical protein